ncbi:unnamed protein product [Lathyrus sativus]|nr:unnamed protein product [Lathyrus sativus]
MNNHINILMLISFLLIIITTFFPQLSHSQSVDDYSICRDINHSYNCGNLSKISYPFWGQNRPFQCGAGTPFHLFCYENSVTTILLSSQNFTVLEINTTTYTIKLKRTDLSLNLCSPQFGDTSLSPTLFQYLPKVKNITIYYNCTSSQFFPKKSLCGASNHAFCPVGDDANKFLEESRNCNRYIQVPVGGDFPIENGYYHYVNSNVLEKGLDKGFDVKYNVNEECLRCLGSQEGDCVSDYIEKHATSSCYYDNCPDGSIAFSSQCSSQHKSKLLRWHGKMKTILGFWLLMQVLF